ncbi:MAG: pyridoxal-phosphate dependent enzyme [Anaerolineales bacterium]|nr:pyridoxal-phosphate dependent enzyme [Anaerolineales bacterium]
MSQLQPSPAAIQATTSLIEPFQPLAQLVREPVFSRALGAEIYTRYEFLNPVRSFKIRGALALVDAYAKRGGVARLVTVSTGNHGSAMAFACQQYGIPLTVGVPVDCNPNKVKLMRQFGAELEFVGADFDETKETIAARSYGDGVIYIEDGADGEITTGTATIGREILAELPEVDVVLIPVGNGALIGGIGSAIKADRPETRIIGVQSAGAPCMTLSYNAAHVINTETADTFAGGMAVRVAIPEAVALMREVVDEMVLVPEAELKQAMAAYAQHGSHQPEGAGCGALAAAVQLRDRLQSQTVCLIATGGNVEDAILAEISAGHHLELAEQWA